MGKELARRRTILPRASTAKSSSGAVVTTTLEMPQENQNGSPPKSETKPDFWSYMQSLTPEEWKEHVVYLTREEPKTSINGLGGYLTKMMGPFEIDDVKNAFGGVRFSYIMKKGPKVVYGGDFRIEAPPRYDLVRERPDAMGGNGASSQDNNVKTLLEKIPNTKEALAQSMDMVTTAYKTSLNNIAEAGGRVNNGGEGGEMTKLLIAMMQSQTQMLTTMMTAVFKSREEREPAAQVNVATQVDSLLGIVEKLRDFGGGGGKTDWKATLAEKAADHLPEIISGIQSFGDKQIALENARRARVEAVERATVAVQQGGPPAQAPSNGNPQPVRPLSTVAAPAEMPNPGNLPVVTFEQLGFNRIVEMVYRGEDGGVVMDFLYGLDPRAYDYLIECDAAGIRAILGADPMLAKILEYPHLDDFIAQVVEYSGEIKAARADETASKEPVKVN